MKKFFALTLTSAMQLATFHRLAQRKYSSTNKPENAHTEISQLELPNPLIANFAGPPFGGVPPLIKWELADLKPSSWKGHGKLTWRSQTTIINNPTAATFENTLFLRKKLEASWAAYNSLLGIWSATMNKSRIPRDSKEMVPNTFPIF